MNNEKKILALAKFAREKDLEELIWEREGTSISLKRESVTGVIKVTESMPPIEGAEIQPSLQAPKKTAVTSPMVGRFRRSLEEKRPPIVVEGDTIEPGQKLGIVEAMNIPKDIISQVHGIITKALVEDASPVEYGQPLFEVELMEKTG